MEIRIHKVRYEVYIFGFLLWAFLCWGTFSLIKNYIEVKEVEKKGYLTKAILLEIHHKSKGSNYAFVQVLNGAGTKLLYISAFNENKIGNTILVQYLSPAKMILECHRNEFHHGPNNIFAVVLGIIACIVVPFGSIHKSEKLTKYEKYDLKRKRYLYKKGEKHKKP